MANTFGKTSWFDVLWQFLVVQLHTMRALQKETHAPPEKDEKRTEKQTEPSYSSCFFSMLVPKTPQLHWQSDSDRCSLEPPHFQPTVGCS